MAKFYGAVGYGIPTEVPSDSDIWIDVITEINYAGDVIRKQRNLEAGDNLNPDITLSNSISILADEFAIENFAFIKYVEWGGVRWTVTTVEVQRPRLILNMGRVYNGPGPTPPEEP